MQNHPNTRFNPLFSYVSGFGDATSIENIQAVRDAEGSLLKDPRIDLRRADLVKFAQDTLGNWHNGYFFRDESDQIMFLSRYLQDPPPIKPNN